MELADDWKDYEILDMAERRKIRALGKLYSDSTRSTDYLERKNLSKSMEKI